MKTLLTLFFMSAIATAYAQTGKYYELRIYYATPGKLDTLIQRFNDHTTRIFEKHGMENVGYWLPVDNEKNTIYYILAYPNKDARQKSWADFAADPEWKDVSAKTGKIVDSVKSVFMYKSDILPAIASSASTPDRLFELRTYHCYPTRLAALTKRFTNHTVKLFEKHKMTNIAYFNSEEPAGQQSDLVYLLAFKDSDAATKSWGEFRADPEWVKAKEASEKDGKIIESVESVFLTPLPFSKIR